MGSSTEAGSTEASAIQSKVVSKFKLRKYFDFEQHGRNIVAFWFLSVTLWYGFLKAYLFTIKNAIFHPNNIFGLINEPKKRVATDTELSNKKYGNHSYIQLQDIKLHFVQNGDGSKPLLLLIHGAPDFWLTFGKQLEHYKNTHWVVAVDLRGSGDSEKPTGLFSWKYYGIDYFLEDIKSLIFALRRENEANIIVGHGFGGTVVYEFVQKYPELASKYITINSAPYLGVSWSTAIFTYWFQYFAVVPLLPVLFLRQYDLSFFDHIVSKELLESYKFTFGKPGALLYPVFYYRANLLKIISEILFGIPDLAKKKLIPGLAIYGEKSRLNNAKAFAHANKFPLLTTKQIPNGDDYIHQNNPDEVHQSILEFLNTEPPSNSTL